MKNNGKTGLIFIALLGLCAPLLSAKTYYVKTTGNDDDAGTSWSVAFRTITKALNTAKNSDSIWVAEGTYKEGHTLGIPSSYELWGGFCENEQTPEDRDLQNHKSIIDGENLYGCISTGMYSYVDGFHITNGKGSDFGGIRNYGDIKNCWIYNNISSSNGGGLVNFRALAQNCYIYQNTAVYGGGIYTTGGSIDNSVIFANEATDYAGGVSSNKGVLTNCTVYGNNAPRNGGIFHEEGTIYNSIVWNNQNGDIFSWRASVIFSCCSETSYNSSNIQANPLFVNTKGDMSTWDFHLKDGSPCIDAGSLVNVPNHDIEGNPRPGADGKVCMGSYESLPEFEPSDPAPPILLYVSKNGSNKDGSSWETALTSIKGAMIASGDDYCSIWVKQGTYQEKEPLCIQKRMSLFGGFSGVESSFEERDPWQRPTIIDGESNFVCAVNYGILDGFHLTKGESAESGGGVKNYGALSNSRIYDNESGISGGGISNLEGIVENCMVYKNQADNYGGGIYNYAGLILNCMIYYNTSLIGGGVYSEEGMILNCTVYRNIELNYAAGIYNKYGDVINTISWNNEGDDIWTYEGVNDPSYSCYGEALKFNENIRENPLFVNTSGDIETWDLRLRNGSPCIGAASVEDSPPYDIFENPRPGEDGKACIGAYEAPSDYATSQTLPSKILYVHKNGNNTTGDSWENAFISIDKALSIPTGDDIYEIRVAKGTYQEGKTIGVSRRVRLYGGFYGNEKSLEERRVTSHPTIIDGEKKYRCIYNNGVMDGLSVTRGLHFSQGGGVYNEYGLINQCFIYENGSSDLGGGAYNFMGDITDTDIFGNYSDFFGAGVYNMNGSMSNCTVRYNTINYITQLCGGAGVYNQEGKVFKCEIYLNNSQSDGGGVFNNDGLISNCVIYHNYAFLRGGGVYNYGEYGFALLDNCTIFNNNCENDPGGVYGDFSIINNCVVWGNQNWDIISGSSYQNWASYSCFGEATGANGNINAEPLFVNALGANSVWDFRLQKDSPCIDAGNPDESYNDGCIPPGRKTSRNDMGAFGGPLNCLWLDDVTTGVIADILLARDDLTSPTIPYIDQNADESLDISDLVLLLSRINQI
ncbi:DUF1565 domain-containing protein [Candidatus Sumerlaeota bacterium]|nr:DUF1565 domain-containing protein [Candidatus Sumerlaeota bacterium]